MRERREGEEEDCPKGAKEGVSFPEHPRKHSFSSISLPIIRVLCPLASASSLSPSHQIRTESLSPHTRFCFLPSTSCLKKNLTFSFALFTQPSERGHLPALSQSLPWLSQPWRRSLALNTDRQEGERQVPSLSAESGGPASSPPHPAQIPQALLQY